MSYQVLARKWRPGTFSEMVGQTHVLRALANALDQNRLHHAYLFTGTRGVGKTTIARIFAKCVNCETGISSQPCGTCDTCKEIAAGRFVDLIEIDAASHTGVSEIREILDNVQYAPTRGRYKIYLIDEVHMLSNSSFNALLKTLEEPPPHIKFLLATTDPQKLPITVLSRCLQFNLKNLSEKRIQQHLAHVLESEGVTFEDEALWEIARSAEGSMRDALSLTDQAIAFGEGAIRTSDVVDMLGTVDRQVGRKLLAHVTAGQRAEALGLAAQIAERSPDWKVLLQGIAELAHRVTLEQTVPGIVDDSQGDQAFVRSLASVAGPEQLQLIYQIALAGIRDLPYAPTPRIGFEMTLVRMLAFTPECPTGIIPPAGSGAQHEPTSQVNGVSDTTASMTGTAPSMSQPPGAQTRDTFAQAGDEAEEKPVAVTRPEHETEPTQTLPAVDTDMSGPGEDVSGVAESTPVDESPVGPDPAELQLGSTGE
ncbi:MAG: DNA polymerase III subunit gamma/tau, partial [Gammaproteobacteria bacterium]